MVSQGLHEAVGDGGRQEVAYVLEPREGGSLGLEAERIVDERFQAADRGDETVGVDASQTITR